MLRRSFLELPLFSFLGSCFKDKIKPKSDLNQNLELSEREPINTYEIEPESISKIEEIVLDWLKNTQESMVQIPMTAGSLQPTYILFARSVVNIKTCSNVWEQWHIATSSQFDKIISLRVKIIDTTSFDLLDKGFKMPNEIRSERYDGTSYL